MLINFTPKYATSYSGNLVLTTNADFGNNTINLRGTGIANTAVADENVNFDVYPNPASDNIFVSTDAAVSTIEIVDLLGNILVSQNATKPNQSIDVSNLPAGVYSLRVTTNKGNLKTKPFLIHR